MDTTVRRTRDEWLALRCKLGESGAFEDLVREFERPLLYFATKLLANEDAAFDVIQDVWLCAFRSLKKLDTPCTVRTWLYRMAHDRAIDRIRQNRSRERAEQSSVELKIDEEGPEPRFDEEDAAKLHGALDRIDLKHREVIVLHFLEDMPIADIAGVIGIPAGTVKSRIHHAKRALKEALQEP